MDLYEIRRALSMGMRITDLKLRVTYYARVSTDTDEQLHSLTAQVDYFSQYIESIEEWTLVQGYVDEGVSGTAMQKRVAFLKMLEDARLKNFDFIITKEISRFSRNTLDSIQSTQQLLQYGVGVLFQSDNINTLMPDSELRLTLMSSIAQEEVRKLSERVKFGFKRSIENGVVLGNNNIWGYRKNNGLLEVVEEASVIRKIFELYTAKGYGIRRIARELSGENTKNLKGKEGISFNTVRGILSNPKYKGWYVGSKTQKIDYKMSTIKKLAPSEWVMYPDPERVPPIVSEAIWEKAQHILKGRREKNRTEGKSGHDNQYSYSGKILCPIHQCHYYRSLYRYQSGNREVWHCKQYAERGKIGCDFPNIYTSELNQVVRKILDFILEDRSKIGQKLLNIYEAAWKDSNIRKEILKIEEEIQKGISRKEALLDLSLDGLISKEEYIIRKEHIYEDMAQKKPN